MQDFPTNSCFDFNGGPVNLGTCLWIDSSNGKPYFCATKNGFNLVFMQILILFITQTSGRVHWIVFDQDEAA